MKTKPYAVLLGEILIANWVIQWQLELLDYSMNLLRRSMDTADQLLDNAEWCVWVMKMSSDGETEGYVQ